MRRAGIYRKRPCRICRRWFVPNAKLKDRQKTCGAANCKREWHRKKCTEWNKNNPEYFRSNYLHKKLDTASRKALQVKTRLKSGLPSQYVQEVIGIQELIIIEYLAQLLFRRFQAVFSGQVAVMTGKMEQLPNVAFSRCDRL